MERNTFSALDFGILAGMLSISSFIGIFYAWKDRKEKSNDTYLVGNRNMDTIPVSLSLAASFLSSNTVLGFPAEVYVNGLHFMYIIVACIFAIVVSAEIFLPIFHPLKVTSVNEYLLQRFESRCLQVVISIVSIIAILPYLGVVLYGPSITLSSVTNLDVTPAILVVGLICTFYTAIGGMKAVVWTDVVQIILMYSGLLAVIIQGTKQLGGFTEMWRIASEGKRTEMTNFSLDFYAPDTVWNVSLGMGIVWTSAYSVTQMQVQRYCSLRTIRKAKIALYLNLPALAFSVVVACFCGLVIFANYSECDPLQLGLIKKPDQIMPFFVMDAFSSIPGFAGLFVAAVFSGSLSTLSSGFAAIAAMVWDDLLKRRLNIKDQHALWLTKLVAALVGVTVVGVAFLVGIIGSVIKAAVALSGSMQSCVFAIFLASAFIAKSNAKGAIAGLISGTLVTGWIVIGSLLYPSPKHFKPTSVSGCRDNTTIPQIWTESLSANSTGGTQAIQPVNLPDTPLLYNLYHIHFLWIPVIAFLIAFLVTILVSILTGGNSKEINPRLMSPLAKIPRANRPNLEPIKKVPEIQLIGISYHTKPEEALYHR